MLKAIVSIASRYWVDQTYIPIPGVFDTMCLLYGFSSHLCDSWGVYGRENRIPLLITIFALNQQHMLVFFHVHRLLYSAISVSLFVPRTPFSRNL